MRAGLPVCAHVGHRAGASLSFSAAPDLLPGRFGFSPGYEPVLKLFISSQAPRDRVGGQMSQETPRDLVRGGVSQMGPWRVNRSLVEKGWMCG